MTSLEKAILIWQNGGQISLTLAAVLIAQGYDVDALETKHFK